MKLLFVTSFFIFTFNNFLYAKEIKSPFQSVRAFGRGGTFAAAFDSDEASRLNPATIAESSITYQMRLLQVDGSVGENTLSTISDILNLASSPDLSGFLSEMSQKFGQQQDLRGQFSFLAQRFGSIEIAPIFSNFSSLELQRPQLPSLIWESDTYGGALISYAMPLFKNFYAGITLIPYYRWYIAGDLDVMDILDFVPPSKVSITDLIPIAEGFSIATNLGIIWSPSETFRTGLTIHNFGYTQTLTRGSNNLKPPLIPQKISFGLLYRYELPHNLKLDISYDHQDLLNPNKYSFFRLIHTGLELGYCLISRDLDYGVNFGINEGYLTSGLFFDLYVLRLDIVNYAVELGNRLGDKEDRRWAFSARSTITF